MINAIKYHTLIPLHMRPAAGLTPVREQNSVELESLHLQQRQWNSLASAAV